MIDQPQMNEFLLSLGEVSTDDSLDSGVIGYRVASADPGDSKLFAVIEDGSQPLKVSLRCDPQLAKTLRRRYETVLPAEKLSKKHWNTIICSGQLAADEVKDLARHSYLLAANRSA